MTVHPPASAYNFDQLEGFDWDEGNARKNEEKHGVEYQECEEVFFNQPLVVQEDHLHSQQERRLYALGKTNQGRRLFIAFTIRKNRIRVISARDQHKKERSIYEAA